jgi:7-carboxy-7-deazaguanine synthase
VGNAGKRCALFSVKKIQAVQVELESPILDIFASRQGEGICVGDPQIFVRFGGCNEACDYCDTPESIPIGSGHRESLKEVLGQVRALDKWRPAKAVSLTGGEPLLQVAFLERLIPELRQDGHPIYLETNGTLPRALERVVEGCDWIAMDVKPQTAIGRDQWEAHRWFLKTGGKKIFVKMVLTATTREEELQRAVDLINGVRPDIPFVLQPATAWGTAKTIPLTRLASWWALAARQLLDVRILPQVHRLWAIP